MNIPAKFCIATAEQSRQIDSRTIDDFGIDAFTLMETAGRAASQSLIEQLTPGDQGVFLCGKGNNGGDALVVARYLAQHNIQVEIVFVGGDDSLSKPAQKNLTLLKTIAEKDRSANLRFYTRWHDFDASAAPDFIIDGMLGTGLDSELRGDYPDAVTWANAVSCPTYAMDIPTGLHADDGRILGEVITAKETFAFGTLKQGYYLGDGPDCTGEIRFCELPFPHYLANDIKTHLMDASYLPERNNGRAAHKYEAGVVYIIAGSEGLTGAAIMAAKSAWAQGVGAVMLVCPRGVLRVFENNLPQVIKKPVGGADDAFFKREHVDDVRKIIAEKKGVILLGPGMGRQPSTVDFIHQFLDQAEGHLVIDADALWALGQRKKWSKPSGARWILTPHPGELATILDEEIEDDAGRLKKVRKAASDKEITLLSKGFPVMLGNPDGDIFISDFDSRIFSRAGFGDVLAGKTAAFNALGHTQTASCIHALLHGEQKARKLISSKGDIIEPLDLL